VNRLQEHLSFNARMKKLLANPEPKKENWLKKWFRKLWALLFLASLLGCAARKPVTAPPPPVLNSPKVRALQKGDWIMEHCELAQAGSCYCHRPREKVAVKGDPHKVIECR
jgi:hypothetical protein